jgi:hypothetical protein
MARAAGQAALAEAAPAVTGPTQAVVAAATAASPWVGRKSPSVAAVAAVALLTRGAAVAAQPATLEFPLVAALTTVVAAAVRKQPVAQP